MLNKDLELTLNLAFRFAREKRHEYMTVEHLLLALLDNPAVKKIAEKHQAGVGQILIAWSIARSIAVIPKSINKDRIKDNLKAADLILDQDDLTQLANIGVSHRFVDGSFFTGPQSPYKLTDLWDS